MLSRRRISVVNFVLLALAVFLLPASTRQSKPMATALAPIELLVEGLGHLQGITVDGTGAVFVSDRQTGNIFEIVAGERRVVAGDLKRPIGVTLDGEGRLIFVEGGRRRVLRLEEDGEMRALASGLEHPRWIGAAPDGSVYVTARSLASREGEGDEDESESEVIARVEPDGKSGVFAHGFRGLQGLAVEQDAVLVAARGRKGERHALGTLYSIPIESGGRAGPVVPVAPNQFVGPAGLAVDRLGARFVSAKSLAEEPWHRHVILRIAQDGTSTPFAENLEDPRGLAFGPDGSLYVADGRSGRVLRFVAPRSPVLDENPPTVTSQRQIALRLRTEAGARLTVPGGQLPVSAMADHGESALISVPLHANAENHLLIFATGAAGRGLTSAPVEVTVIHDDRPPSIELLTPKAGTLVRDTIAAEIFAVDANGIAEVEFRMDGSFVGLDAVAPFRLTLDTKAVADGPRTLSAIARDRAGNVASVAAQITVDNTPPEVRLVRPAPGFNGSGAVEVMVEARDATSGVARVEVAVNGVLRFVAETPPYRFQFDPRGLGAGPHVLVAAAADRAGNRGESAPVSVALSGVTVGISEPGEGAQVPAGPVLVRGRVEASGAEVGVTVNGLPAAVQETAFAALVPVTLDTTILTAVATTDSGLTASNSVAISVSSTAVPTAALLATPASGVVPMTVRFSLFGALAPAAVELDFDGNGTVDFAGPNLNGQTFTYSLPGLYLPTASITDAQGRRVTASGVVQVFGATAIDTLLQPRWRTMKDALRVGDIPRAVTNITARTRADYEAAFNIISASLPNIDSILTDIALMEIRNAAAIYEMTRVDDGIPMSFGVRFAIDEDGLWRIEAF